jgi:hypothetical protein
MLDCFSLLIFHPIPSFSLVPTSESRHHFSFSCTLSPQILFCHIPLRLPVVPGFFDSFPCFLFVCEFVPFTQLNIPPSSFCSQSFRFFTGIPAPLLVFLSLLLFVLKLSALFPAFTLSLFLLQSFLTT